MKNFNKLLRESIFKEVEKAFEEQGYINKNFTFEIGTKQIDILLECNSDPQEDPYPRGPFLNMSVIIYQDSKQKDIWTFISEEDDYSTSLGYTAIEDAYNWLLGKI